MHGAGVLLDSVCLVTLVSSEQSSQFEKFRLQHVKIAINTSTFKNTNDWQYCLKELTAIAFLVPDNRVSAVNYFSANSEQGSW